MIRPVILHPDARLRVLCRPVGDDLDAARRLAADLFDSLYHAQGRGLAAPQIGADLRVFVMDADWKDGAPAPRAMIDPVIVEAAADTAAGEERCLSIPDRPVAVTRPVRVRLAWRDLDGARHDEWLEGPAARIAQHERDHLDGRLVVDG